MLGGDSIRGGTKRLIRVATVADERFRRRAAHLARSLERSPNEYRLTIYCDDAERFSNLRGHRCEIVEIADMRRLGAKRAKFTALAAALREGSTIYLDADAIVLESLDDLWGGPEIKGVFVDLREQPDIANPLRPWLKDPSLINRRYLMSGGFFAPEGRHSFFEELRLVSLDDELWRKYTDTSLDQRFLNAFINIHDEPVTYVDPRVFGWEGLLKNGHVQVYRSGSRLLNKQTHDTLKLVLFGGVQQTPETLRSLPIDVAALLFERISPTEAEIDSGLAQIYRSLSPFLSEKARDPLPRDILGLLLAEIPRLSKICAGECETGPSYFSNPEAMKAIAFSTPPSDRMWNGLPCGGPHWGEEGYHWLRRTVRDLGAGTVLQTGAGEICELFRDEGITTYCLVYEPSPSAERAFELGCAILRVPLHHDRHVFAESELSRQIAAHNISSIDLLVLDSASGKTDLRDVLSQLITQMRVRFVLYPDAVQDPIKMLRDQERHGLKLVSYCGSARGPALFSVPDRYVHRVSAGAFDAATIVREPKVYIAVTGPVSIATFRNSQIRVRLRNAAESMLSSDYTYPVHVAYHWLRPDGAQVVFDGERTRLPCDVDPGDVVEFAIDVLGPGLEGEYLLQIDVVQESICWFGRVDPESMCTVATFVRDCGQG
jgi:hypothetical protein